MLPRAPEQGAEKLLHREKTGIVLNYYVIVRKYNLRDVLGGTMGRILLLGDDHLKFSLCELHPTNSTDFFAMTTLVTASTVAEGPAGSDIED